MANAPDTLEGTLDDLSEALARLDDHAEDYLKARGYYRGDVGEIVANKALQRMLQKNAQAHKLAFAGIPVDALFDKVELDGLSADNKAASAILSALWDENDLEDEGDDWHRKAGYFGDYYVIIDVLEVSPAGTATSAKLLGSSPLTTVTMYSTRDDRTELYSVKRWSAQGRWYANVYYDDETVSLVTKAKGKGTDAAEYVPAPADPADPESFRQGNPWGSPVFHFRVDGKPYGQPVHLKAFGPQDAITKINANHMGTIDYVGAPQRYALLDGDASVGDDDIDDDFGTDGLAGGSTSPDGQTTTTTGTSKLSSSPGSAWMLSGVKSVGEFSVASEAPFLNSEVFQIRAMSTITGTPLFEFDMGGDQPSGEARRRASGRINKHADKVKRSLGQTWANVAAHVLRAHGVAGVVSVNWAPTETETDADGLALVSLKIKAGVPVRQAFLEAGYSVAQVDEWYPEDAPNVTPELLTVFAEALAKLGQAVTLGTLSSAELVDMLPAILTGPRREATAPTAPTGTDVVAPTSADPALVKAQADALGALVRAGADPTEAGAFLGFDGVSFPNVPTTVRVPEVDATALEA